MLKFRPVVPLLAPLLLPFFMFGCSDAKFVGANPSQANDNPGAPTTPSTPTPTPPGNPPVSPPPVVTIEGPSPQPPVSPPPSSPPATPPVCTKNSQVTGARIAFLVDNSGSNSATDCPSPTAAGTTNGTDTLFTCGAQTEREAAVLASYDLLAQAATKGVTNALATSELQIASFPTVANVWTGWTAQTTSWVAIDATNRASVANSMLFAREPRGVTPFAAAMTAATQFFANVPSDGRANVAILLSDGEATDSNPAAVEAQAGALTKAGVKVFVMIYGGTLASGAQSDSTEMQKLNAANISAGNGSWYTSNYASFDAYIQALIGVNGEGGLATSIASTPQDVVQLQNASALTAAIQSLLATQVLTNCTGN